MAGWQATLALVKLTVLPILFSIPQAGTQAVCHPARKLMFGRVLQPVAVARLRRRG